MSLANYVGTISVCTSIVMIAALPMPIAAQDGCPVVLDLDGSGKIETTGQSSAWIRFRSPGYLGKLVKFDIDADGDEEWIEWIASGSDGILLDLTNWTHGQKIDGRSVIGNAEVDFANGFEKLEKFDRDKDGSVSGSEMENIAIWKDRDLDAQYDEGEVFDAEEIGLSSISIDYKQDERDGDGIYLVSSATMNDGEPIYVEDVFFGEASNFSSNSLDVAGFLNWWRIRS